MPAGRTTAVLEAFPRHLGATDPGKRIRHVVDGLAAPVDTQSRQLGDVRRAHRLPDTPTRRDLLALAALHRLGPVALALVDQRLAGLAALAAESPLPTGDLEVVLGLPFGALDDVDPEILAAALAARTSTDGRLDLARRTVTGVVEAFRLGNGTATALLSAAAALVGLEVLEVGHSAERWWHLARCRDLLALEGLTGTGDLVALEENPFQPITVEPVDRRHGDRFRILRGGLEAVTVGVRVVGVGERTVGPMVVNVDEGRGVAFTGAVPDGAELVFEASGSVVLGGTDVTGSAYGFSGAVFASAEEIVPDRDFVLADAADVEAFGDRAATFAVSAPVTTAFGSLAGFPHAAAGVAPLQMALGQSRWAVFLAVAHLGAVRPRGGDARGGDAGGGDAGGGDAGDGSDGPALPVPFAAVADRSVFADDRPIEQHEPAVRVGFAWEEREPFTVRVILPRRLAVGDDEAGALLREPLRALLDRHRAAGVRLEVTYAEERWELGDGITRDADSDEALGTVVVGTTLWPDPEDDET